MLKHVKRLLFICLCWFTVCTVCLPCVALGEGLTTDYTTQSWTDAFESLNNRFSAEYAFTDWKGIDWSTLAAQCRAKVQKAQESDDFDAYYLAIREYVTAIPDGHVRVTNLPEIDYKYVGGGFGFSPALLSDGSLVVCWVDEASDAYAAGMRAGDVLVNWNGVPAAQAAAQSQTEFTYNSATLENAALKHAQYLGRAPVGTTATVECRHPGSQETYTLIAKATDDGGLTLQKNYPDAVVPDQIRDMILGVEYTGPKAETMVTYRLLEGNIAYIHVLGELDVDLTDVGTAPSTLAQFREAVQKAVDANVSGMILDIRNNVGGLDEMTADMLGSFYSEKTLFEYQNVYDSTTGKRSIEATEGSAGVLYIEPEQPSFTGRVIALINQKCLSCGEGLALGIRNLQNGDTMGFYGTNGSFGLAGSEAAIPGGLTVYWPSGQSLNAEHIIQLDSQNGIGGVAPTLRIPMTAENALRVAQGEDVELEEALAVLQSK